VKLVLKLLPLKPLVCICPVVACVVCAGPIDTLYRDKAEYAPTLKMATNQNLHSSCCPQEIVEAEWGMEVATMVLKWETGVFSLFSILPSVVLN